MIAVNNASAGIPPDLIDNTSNPVQAGVLVARVGICRRIAGGLNVRKRHDGRGFFNDSPQTELAVALRTERGVGRREQDTKDVPDIPCSQHLSAILRIKRQSIVVKGSNCSGIKPKFNK